MTQSQVNCGFIRCCCPPACCVIIRGRWRPGQDGRNIINHRNWRRQPRTIPLCRAGSAAPDAAELGFLISQRNSIWVGQLLGLRVTPEPTCYWVGWKWAGVKLSLHQLVWEGWHPRHDLQTCHPGNSTLIAWRPICRHSLWCGAETDPFEMLVLGFHQRQHMYVSGWYLLKYELSTFDF